MSLLERFREGSDFEAEGNFTIDRQKAQLKLSRYQLAQLEDFVLVAIQALVAGNARQLSIVIDSQNSHIGPEVTVVGRGVAFDGDRISNLQEEIFGQSKASAPYQLLAIAVNAATPFCVESPSIQLDDTGSLILRTQLKSPLPNLAEEIKERVLFCPCDVSLNGAALPQHKAESRIYELYAVEESSLILARYGVVIETKNRLSVPGFRGLLHNNDFLLDASCSHVVEDDVFLKAVERMAEQAQKALTSLTEKQPLETHDIELILSWLPRLDHRDALFPLYKIPVFQEAHTGEKLDLLAILNNKRRTGRVLISDSEIPIPLEELVVHRASEQVQNCLTRLFPRLGILQDARPWVETKLRAIHNKKEWESRQRPTQLPPGNYWARTTVQEDNWQAEIGFLGSPGGASVVDVLYQNKLLYTDNLPHFLPPGSQAVINIERAEVNEDWNRLEGADFLRAQTGLDRAIQSAFHNLGRIPESELFPELRAYLLSKLTGPLTTIPQPALQTPLFQLTNQEKWISAEELTRFPKVYIAPPFEPKAKNFPSELFPYPSLCPDRETTIALVAFLGVKKLDSHSLSVELYQRIDYQLLNPEAPKLDGVMHLLRWELQSEELTGEIALTNEPRALVSVACYYRGVRIDEITEPLTRVLGGMAAVQSQLWKPGPIWDSVQPDEGLAQTLQSLKEQFQAMERRAIGERALKHSTKIKLLLAYPELVQKNLGLPLFPRRDMLCYYSLNELLKALRTHGVLLTDDVGGPVHEMVIIRTPDPDAHALLRDYFGSELKLESGRAYFQKEARKKHFLAQAVATELRLPGEYLLQREIRDGNGVLGFGRLDPGETGQVFCYVEGRHVVVKRERIPFGFSAIIDLEARYLMGDYSDVIILPTDLDIIVEECHEMLLQALGSRDPNCRERAFSLLKQSANWPDFPKERMLVLPFLQNYDGSLLSPQDLLQKCSSQLPHIDPSFDEPIMGQREIVVRHTAEDIGIVFSILGNLVLLVDITDELRRENQGVRYLKELQSSLPPRGTDDQEFEGEGIRARLSVATNSHLVGYDPEERILGAIHWKGLPVMGEVWGLQSGLCPQTGMPEAKFNSFTYALFTTWTQQVYLRWFRRCAETSLTPDARSRGLQVLHKAARVIGSSSTCTLGQLAQQLWSMPLFERADSTFVSGAALATEFHNSGRILLAFRDEDIPPEAIVTVPSSVESLILSSIFGQQSLSWHQQLSPAIAAGNPFQGSASHESMQEEDLETAIAEQYEQVETALKTFGLSPWQRLTSRFKAWREKSAKASDGPESRLLGELHSDLANLLGPGQFRSAEKYFSTLDFGTWPLGPAYYRSLTKGEYRLNRSHRGIKWLLSSEGECRRRHLGRLILLIHLVGDVNIVSNPFLDIYEDDFLVSLVSRLDQIVH